MRRAVVTALIAPALAGACSLQPDPAPDSASGAGGGSGTAAEGGGGGDTDATVSIEVAGDGEGVVKSTPGGIDCPGTCEASFPWGSPVLIQPTPAPGSKFVSFAGACTAPPCHIEMEGDKQVTVTFQALQHDLSVTVAGAGSGTVVSAPAAIDCGGTCNATFDTGAIVALTASPDTASAFLGWSGDCSGDKECVVTLDADRNVEATFADNGGKLIWAKQFGDSLGVGTGFGYGVAFDAVGSVVAVGTIEGVVDFGGGPTTTPSVTTTAYVAKLTSLGAYVWSKRFFCTDPAGPAPLGGRPVAVDAAGDVFVAGEIWGSSCDFGGGPLASAGDTDAYVVKLSGATGDHAWSRRIGGADGDAGLSLAVDPSGDVVVGGHASGSVDFGTGPVNLAPSTAFLAKYSGTDGSYLWSRTLGPNGEGNVYALATDSTGNVLAGGTFLGAVDFGAGVVPAVGENDAFVAKYSPDGQIVWATTFGGDPNDGTYGLGVDANGDVFATGMFDGTLVVGQDTWTSAGSADIFLVKLSGADANPIWSSTFGSSDFELSLGLAVDLSGDVAITGYFVDPVDFGGGALVVADVPADTFLAKYEGSEGKHIWSRQYGGLAGAEEPHGLAADPTTGRWAATGVFLPATDFGGVSLTALGYADAFLTLHAP